MLHPSFNLAAQVGALRRSEEIGQAGAAFAQNARLRMVVHPSDMDASDSPQFAPPLLHQAMPVSARDPRLAACGFFLLKDREGQVLYYSQQYQVVLGRASKAPIDVPLSDSLKLSR